MGPDTVRRAAGNTGALFSQTGYSTLIKRAGHDGVLAHRGQRADLSGPQLKDLLTGSIDIVRRRLFEVVKPERQVDIKQAMSEISGVPERVESRRDFAPAQRAILALHSAGELNESALLGFAKEHKYEESVAALSAMSKVKIATLDRLVAGDRQDPILIVGKAIGLEWATVRALILLRLGPSRVASPTDIENARVNFTRLMPSTAERVVNFWQSANRRDRGGLSDLPKSQVSRAAALAFRFPPVSRHGVAGPWQPPVVGAFRGPVKIRRARTCASVQAQ